jgi:hypothetical protein
MANPLYPVQLPDFLRDPSGELSPGYLEFQNDAGPSSRRVLSGAAPDPWDVRVVYNASQWIIFRDFYRVTLLRGTLPFDKADLVTGLLATFFFKGAIKFTKSLAAGGALYLASFGLEQQP